MKHPILQDHFVKDNDSRLMQIVSELEQDVLFVYLSLDQKIFLIVSQNNRFLRDYQTQTIDSVNDSAFAADDDSNERDDDGDDDYDNC